MWKARISPGQSPFTFYCGFPRQVDCTRCGFRCCGLALRCPQYFVACPYSAPRRFHSVAPQAFLILWSNSVIWLNVSGCSPICFVIFCTACIAVV